MFSDGEFFVLMLHCSDVEHCADWSSSWLNKILAVDGVNGIVVLFNQQANSTLLPSAPPDNYSEASTNPNSQYQLPSTLPFQWNPQVYKHITILLIGLISLTDRYVIFLLW